MAPLKPNELHSISEEESAMTKTAKRVVFGLSLAVLLFAGFSVESPHELSFTQEAGAVIGRPLTPMSYAGVARRTTRRAVYAGSRL